MRSLLVIGYVWPEPNSSAAGSHVIALLECFLQSGWQVTFATPAARTDHMFNLESLGIQMADIELNSDSFDNFIKELNPDAVMFDRFMMEEQFSWRVAKQCPDALRLLDTSDLFFLRHARHDHFKKTKEINPTLNKALLFTELAKREIASILRCDLSFIISEVELELLTDLFNIDPAMLAYRPFMLDPISEKEQNALPNLEERDHFISIGNFRHPPNWDAVRFLKESIWPLIRKKLPKAELHIYGAYTPPKATALHNEKQGFLVKGWAESATEVMKNARINLAPLQYGAGLKGKVTDAMSAGTPTITTSIGAEAIRGELPFSGLIENDAQAIADAAVKLYNDKKLWEEKQQNGFAIYNQRFNRETAWKNLIEKIENCINSLEEHRLNNFTGAMLQHHQHKSTQYMSQWIEAKNSLEKLKKSDD